LDRRAPKHGCLCKPHQTIPLEAAIRIHENEYIGGSWPQMRQSGGKGISLAAQVILFAHQHLGTAGTCQRCSLVRTIVRDHQQPVTGFDIAVEVMESSDDTIRLVMGWDENGDGGTGS
jgi:hypothetical protein